ncbi:hypothetical protein LSAT2_022919 [Lamellibrachia satsuma]|nr:hypothetical protein LSAT2_022919 [Lamellibrachia satsuma]
MILLQSTSSFDGDGRNVSFPQSTPDCSVFWLGSGSVAKFQVLSNTLVTVVRSSSPSSFWRGYARPTKMATSMYDKIMKVITNPPESRRDKEIKELLPWFIKKSELFRTLKKDVITDIIKNCQFSSVERDYVIIRQGDRGECFYILLRGTVSIYINNTIADEEEGAEACVKEDTYTAQGELDRTKFGNWIAKIDDGKSFGELALINKNCIRNASIIADETSDLLIVNRELYNRCLHAAQAAEFEQRTSFVANQPLFQHWAHKYKKQMAMSIRKVFVNFEESIIHQGDHVDALYFLLKGQAKIVIDPAHHPVQYPQFYPLEDPDEILAREEMENTIAFRKKVAAAMTLLSPLMVQPFAQRRREVPRKTIEVSIVGHNEIIGACHTFIRLI